MTKAKHLTSEDTIQKLEKYSSSMCFAKFKQITLNLHSGSFSSCCLSPPENIDLSNLSEYDFNNSKSLLEDRSQMLKGSQPDSCQFCWGHEASNPIESSQRISKSSAPWGYESFEVRPENIVRSEPSYLEVSFANSCNLKCLYCNPVDSSSWYAEAKKYGPIPTANGEADIDWIEKNYSIYNDQESNPYVEEFFKWMNPNRMKSLSTLRITGGEPLLSPATFELIESFEGGSGCELVINSNLSVPPGRLEKLIRTIESSQFSTEDITIIASLDTFGKASEYIRSGMDFELFERNLNFLMDCLPEVSIRITSTICLLSLYEHDRFLDWVLKLKSKTTFENRVVISYYPLISPPSLSLKTVGPEQKRIFFSLLKKLEDNRQSSTFPNGFIDYEIDSFRAFQNQWSNVGEWEKTALKADFYTYIQTLDSRRDTQLWEDIPSIQEFWKEAENCFEKKLIYLWDNIHHEELWTLFSYCSKVQLVQCLEVLKLHGCFFNAENFFMLYKAILSRDLELFQDFIEVILRGAGSSASMTHGLFKEFHRDYVLVPFESILLSSELKNSEIDKFFEITKILNDSDNLKTELVKSPQFFNNLKTLSIRNNNWFKSIFYESKRTENSLLIEICSKIIIQGDLFGDSLPELLDHPLGRSFAMNNESFYLNLLKNPTVIKNILFFEIPILAKNEIIERLLEFDKDLVGAILENFIYTSQFLELFQTDCESYRLWTFVLNLEQAPNLELSSLLERSNSKSLAHALSTRLGSRRNRTETFFKSTVDLFFRFAPVFLALGSSFWKNLDREFARVLLTFFDRLEEKKASFFIDLFSEQGKEFGVKILQLLREDYSEITKSHAQILLELKLNKSLLLDEKFVFVVLRSPLLEREKVKVVENIILNSGKKFEYESPMGLLNSLVSAGINDDLALELLGLIFTRGFDSKHREFNGLTLLLSRRPTTTMNYSSLASQSSMSK